MVTTTGAGGLVKTLESFEVEHAFGIPGHHILDIYEHLGDTDIYHVLAKSEPELVRSANGMARITGQPSVAILSAGPGAITGMMGIGEAYTLSIPLVVISGHEPARDGPHGVDSAEVVPNMFSEIAKEHIFLDDPREGPAALAHAFWKAQQARPGPVVVQMPMDVMKTECDIESIPSEPISHRPLPGADNDIDNAINEIEAHEKVAVLIGQGGHRAHIDEEIDAFVDALNAPVAVTYRGMSAYADHDRYMGVFTDWVQHGPAEEIFEQADAVVGIGVREKARRYLSRNLSAKKVHLLDQTERNELTSASAAAFGDLDCILRQIINGIDSLQSDWWTDAIAKWDEYFEERRQEELYELKQSVTRLPSGGTDPDDFVSHDQKLAHPLDIILTLNKLKDPDGIVTSDVGVHNKYLVEFLRVDEPDTVLPAGNWSSMGHAIPAAIGAKLAAPETQVVAVLGDGCLLMDLAVFKTAVEHDLDIVVLLVNNHQHNAITVRQEQYFNRTGYDLIPGFDYAEFARICGGSGFTVEEPSELKETVEEALSISAPSIVDIKTEPNIIKY